MSTNSENNQDFNEKYINWKNWRTDAFGTLDISTKLYYDAEINRTKGTYSNVLEIGFGNGSFLTYAKNRGWNITGIEVNQQLVESAIRNGFDGRHNKKLSEFEDNSFDLVVSFNVLEHLDSKTTQTYLSEIKRVLKNNGFFLATFPNGDSPFGLANQNGDITHQSFIGTGKIKNYANFIEAEIIYMKGAAQPLIQGTVIGTLHRVITTPLKKIIEITIKLIYYPQASIDFFSSNRTMILKIKKS